MRVDPITEYIIFKEDVNFMNKMESQLNELDHPLLNRIIGDNKIVLSFDEVRGILRKRELVGFKSGLKTGKKIGNDYGFMKGHAHGMEDAKELQKARSARAISAVVLAGVIAAIGYAVYKRFLSKAARGCKGKSGQEKTLCMAKYKVAALEAKYKAYRGNGQHCTNSKNPAKCKALIAQKMNKTKDEIRKAKTSKK